MSDPESVAEAMHPESEITYGFAAMQEAFIAGYAFAKQEADERVSQALWGPKSHDRSIQWTEGTGGYD